MDANSFLLLLQLNARFEMSAEADHFSRAFRRKSNVAFECSLEPSRNFRSDEDFNHIKPNRGSDPMMYLLDLSGHDESGKAGLQRYGGLFLTIKDAEAHGRRAAKTERLFFEPSTLWVRDEENRVVRQIAL